MSEPRQDEDVERGAAEEGSGVPLTETEREVSQPPDDRDGEPASRPDEDETTG
jgi:hypothetical protein